MDRSVVAAQRATGAGESTASVAVVSSDAALPQRTADVVAAAGLAFLPCSQDESTVIAEARSVLVIGPDGSEADLWRAAGQLGSAGDVSLPAGSAWLVRGLHDGAVGPMTRRMVVVPVVSAAGGVGASTMAAGLAVTAAAAGLRPLLIDAHLGPAGVDLLLGNTDLGDQWRRRPSSCSASPLMVAGYSPDQIGHEPYRQRRWWLTAWWRRPPSADDRSVPVSRSGSIGAPLAQRCLARVCPVLHSQQPVRFQSPSLSLQVAFMSESCGSGRRVPSKDRW